MIPVTAEEVIRNPTLEKEYWVCWEIMCVCCKRFPENVLETVRQQVRSGKTVRQSASSFKDFRLCCKNILANPTVLSLSSGEKYQGIICKPYEMKMEYETDQNETADDFEAFLLGKDVRKEEQPKTSKEYTDIGESLYIDPLLDLGGPITWEHDKNVNVYMAN